MTIMLPIIEQLANAPDDAMRARWLLRVPEQVLSRDHVAIHDLLVTAGFQDGIAALNAEVAASSAIRDSSGTIPQRIRFEREYARIGLAIIARGGEGKGA
ncbi:hypothetical protein [Pararhizobium sp. DWP3-4]|uniref:hypothetical protein n=1 Tax=Pararhizobium sp. DWP3-4 TaxID=2804565 RepID=UPI003CF2BA3D